MRSTWICSRNDISANGGVLLAAASVVFLQSQWPDILVGSTIAVIFLASALGVLKDSIRSHGHSMSV
jgi:Co/Zn/Cd efflux system component